MIGQLLDYWQGLRKGALMPTRADFRPQEIRRLLPHIVLLERRGPESLIIRLAGTRIYDLFGRDVTGMNLIEITPPEFRATRMSRLSAIIDHPCGSLSEFKFMRPMGATGWMEILALPLAMPGDAPAHQILTLMAEVAANNEELPDARPESIAAPQKFEFFDIGAGCP